MYNEIFFFTSIFGIQTTECTNFLLDLGGDMSYLKWFDLRSGGCWFDHFLIIAAIMLVLLE